MGHYTVVGLGARGGVGNAIAPEWFRAGDRYPPNDPRWHIDPDYKKG